MWEEVKTLVPAVFSFTNQRESATNQLGSLPIYVVGNPKKDRKVDGNLENMLKASSIAFWKHSSIFLGLGIQKCT